MRTAIQDIQSHPSLTNTRERRKLRVVLADESPEYMKVVLTLLELHESIDLIGRAVSFEETIELVVNHQPDFVLIDLDMYLANLVIPAVILSSCSSVKIVGMCVDGTISLRQLNFLTEVNALVHRSQLRWELLSFVDALCATATFGGSISAFNQPTRLR